MLGEAQKLLQELLKLTSNERAEVASILLKSISQDATNTIPWTVGKSELE